MTVPHVPPVPHIFGVKTKVGEGCDPDDKACAVALRKLADAVIRIRRKRPSTPFRLVLANDFMTTRWPTYRERLIADPLLQAMHGAVKEIGRYLFENGGIERMERVCEMAASPRSRWYSMRASYIDHRWDGIGSADKGHWFC